jgi:hypothetical protein
MGDRGTHFALVVASLLALAVMVVALLYPAKRLASPIVTPSIQVDQDLTPGRAHSEPQLNVDPTDHNALPPPTPTSRARRARST